MEENKSYYAIIPATVRYDHSISDKAKLLYGEITALCNEKGFCWASNEYFANLYGVRKETISRLVSLLEKNRYIYVNFRYKEGTKAIENRCISIASPIDREINTYCENSQEPHDEIVKRGIDENVKDNITVFNNTSNNTNTPIVPFDVTSAFETFWEAYPKKMDRKKAQEKFIKICKTEEQMKLIMEGLKEHKKSKDWTKNNGQFVPYAKTWLNDERWNDEIVDVPELNQNGNKQLPEWYHNQSDIPSQEVDECMLKEMMEKMKT